MGKEPLILDGRLLAREVEDDLKSRVRRVVKMTGQTPVLATILIGDNPASATYVRMKGNACARIGVVSLKIEMPADSKTDEVIQTIVELNRRPDVFGILLQHPVPHQVDEMRCFDAIDPAKDADGVNSADFGAMAMKFPAYQSATARAIMRMLARFDIPVAGREAVVIGRSPILGKPVAMLLLNADATVTVCHSKTQNLPDVIRRADIVVAAVGRPRFVQADWIRKGAVIVDAGYNPGNIGDVDLANAAPHSSAYSPVPGGVGPVTISMLLEQTVEAAEKRAGL